MIIRICRKEASKRLNINNTVQAERSAVTDSQHLGCVSERRDLAYVPIADNHIIFALVQSMTDSCSYFSMWRVFDTLSSRGFAIPTLRSRWSLSMGLLRFSLFEAAKNQSFIKLEPNIFVKS